MSELEKRIAALSPEKRAELLRRMAQKGGPAPAATPGLVPPPRKPGDPSPLSFAQLRLWFLEQLQPGNALYNIPAALRLRGTLDVGALRQGLNAVVARHESLRSAFVEKEGEPFQVSQPSVTLELPVIDLRSLPEDRREAEATRISGEEARKPFDLGHAPLARATLVALGDQEHLLLLTVHHIVFDGGSLGVLIRELVELYRASVAGRAPALPPLTLQYADFAAWQRQWLSGDELARQMGFWKERLAHLPPLELPTDHPRPPEITYRGAHLEAWLPAPLSEAVGALGRKEGATPFMVLLAAFEVLLSRYTGQTDLAVGIPVSGRSRRELEGLIGFFVNTLVVRASCAGDPSFREVLSRVREACLGAYAHQDVPFEKLVDALQVARDLSRTPLFQVMFVFQDSTLASSTLELPGLSLSAVGVDNGTSKFDLSLVVTETARGLACTWEYSTDLFEAETVRRMTGHFERLVEGLVADPGRRVSRVPLLGDGERRRVVEEWNQTWTERRRDACVHALFEEQAKKTPDAVAVEWDGGKMTYAELEKRSNQLAWRLKGMGVGPEVRVAVCVERSGELLVALMGVLKAGGAYVPVDATYPTDRIAFMVENTGSVAMLTQEKLRDRLPEELPPVVYVDQAGGERTDAPAGGAEPANLAYVIHTSGSTGRPKGVEVRHREVVNLIDWVNQRYAMGPSDRVLFVTSPCFDLSVYDVFGMLAAGGTVRVVSEEKLREPEELGRMLREERITFWDSAPAALQQVVPSFGKGGLSLRLVFLSGDWIPLTLPGAVKEAFKNAKVVGLGGATEATIWSNFFEVEKLEPGWTSIPYGRPIQNARYYVLDRGWNPAPVGVAGDLYIGGECLAWGYAREPGLTAERFVPDPYAGRAGARMYWTGDRARFFADGNIEFLGRADQQVKVRGYRVELEEIEARLVKHPEVRAGAVAAKGDPRGDRRLVGYVVAKQEPGPTVSELRKWLQQALPEYMVPGLFVRLDSLPLTSNGKLDRQALPDPEGTRPELEKQYAAPRNKVEEQLAAIWAAVLRLERVGIEDNFFELGGDSIVSLQIISRSRQAGLRFTARQLFQHQTIAQLAPTITSAAVVEVDQGPVTGPVPLTPIQHWFFQQQMPEPHHFNQAVMLEVRDTLDAALLEQAIQKIVEHHDALRLRFVHGPAGWQQVNSGLDQSVSLQRVDVSKVPESERRAAVERASTEAQASLDIVHGPLLRAALFDRGPEQRPLVLLAIHHLAIDGVSWQPLLEDLTTVYQQLRRGEPVALPPKTTSFKAWAERLVAHAQSDAVAAELPYWLSESRRKVRPLPIDKAGGANTLASARGVRRSLGEEETRALLQEVPAAYRGHINDVLLSALAQGFQPWTGEGRLLVDLEGHGREELFDDVDLARTVGWFTAMYPVLLEVAAVAPVGLAVGCVREALRQIPNRGIGYGLLRFLRTDGAAQALAALPRAQVSFSYMGQLDGMEAEASTFALAREPSGPVHGQRGDRTHLLEVNGYVHQGKLELELTYSENLHARETIEALADGFVAALRAIVSQRSSPEAAYCVPSDFPLARLDQPVLDRLVQRQPRIEDIYPLSPMQQGMLFHTLLSPGMGMYFEQFTWVLRGAVDVLAYRRAWEQAVARNPILRTAFCWEGLAEPLQVVLPDVALPWQEHDWRGLSAGEQQARLLVLLREDRERDFDLARAPLVRLVLIRLEDAAHRFIFSFHHILLDGWSMALLLQEVAAIYRALSRGEQPRLQPAAPYREYLAWLQRQDVARAEATWRRMLEGFTTPTPLPGDRGPGRGDATALLYDEGELNIPAGSSAAVQAFARQHQLTLNVVAQGAWAIVLGRTLGEQDVLFGMTIAGRPADLSGVESMIGLFINTLPVRVRLPPRERVLAFLQGIQARQLELQPYEHCPLSQLQAWSEVPRGTPLFEILYICENYPVQEQQGGGTSIGEFRAIERPHYPFAASVIPGPELQLRISFEGQRCDPVLRDQMLRHWRVVLEAMVARPEQQLWELPLLEEEERRRILLEWSASRAPTPAACLHELIEAEATRSPEAVALLFQGTALTYGVLSRRAHQLAHHLRARGVGPEVIVGLCVERGPALIVGMLGILEAGGAYLPLDPDHPSERLALILEESRASVLVTEEAMLPRVPSRGEARVCLDRDGAAISREPEAPLRSGVGPHNLAYIIYTSGSTGRPKGVAVEHRGASNTIRDSVREFRLGPGSRVLQLASPTFDVSVLEIFTCLAGGGTLVLASTPALAPGLDLVQTLRDGAVDTLMVTPAVLATLAPETLPSLRTVIVGGEACGPELIDRWASRCRFINSYGPSEVSVVAMQGDLAAGAGTPVLGRPVAGGRVHVLDEHLQPVPAGVTGELYVAGVGLARGYLGRPDLTAERFVPDPFSAEPGARLYRTGDLGRYRFNGDVELSGRADHQVKLRGFRVELGEIEAALAAHPRVKESVAVVREDAPGDKRLVAYVVAKGEPPNALELRGFLKDRLPAYMVPSAFVALAELPLTANRKIDRRALPRPEERRDETVELVGPRGPVEEMVASIWRDVLAVGALGVHESFFELGGHSLLATRVISRLRSAFQVELPLQRLFDAPTVAGLARAIEALLRQGAVGQVPPLKASPRTDDLPLSFAQQRLWFLDQLEPGSHAYNVPLVLWMKGALNAAALERCLQEIVRRHEVLRTTFASKGGQPVQVIAPELRLSLPVVELGTLPPDTRRAEANRLAREEVQRPFDLARGPLIRTTLLKLEPELHVLLLTLHHIACDGWSVGVLLAELKALYGAYLRGQPSPLPALSIQYADFAVWQNGWLAGDVLEAQLAYWKKALAGAPAEIDLPADHPRPAVQSYRGAVREVAFPKELSTAIKALAVREGATLFMTLLAAIDALLFRYTGQADIVVGTDVANRGHAETEPLIGFFVNQLPLRTRLDGNPTFAELLSRVRETALSAYAHQDAPFEEVVKAINPERSFGRSPLFQVKLTVQNAPMPSEPIEGLAIEGGGIDRGVALFDLLFTFGETPSGIEGDLEYSTDLFEPKTVERMLGHLQALLTGAVRNPNLRLSELPLLAEDERRELVEACNRTERDYPKEESVHGLFEAQVKRTPEAVAVEMNAERVTYRELNARAGAVARQLRTLGVGREDRVGLLVERSVDMVAGLLGVLKAGGAYVPLDPEHPEDRLRFVVEDARVKVVLAQEKHRARLAGSGVNVVALEGRGGGEDERSERVDPGNLAYVLYTSGSTGRPKGVMVEHRGVVNYLSWCKAAYGLEEGHGSVVHSPLGFDLTVTSLLAPLMVGQRVVLVPEEGKAEALVEALKAGQGYSLLKLTPAHLRLLARQLGPDALAGKARALVIGGEALTAEMVEPWRVHAPETRLINEYGPTEAVVGCCVHEVTDGDAHQGAVRIGRPIMNARLYVLDGEGQPVPVGVEGELYIAGDGVARGYLGRPELTAERFVPDPFSPKPGGRLYRTGDVVRRLSDGSLEYLGRRDEQVKVRGYRIELGEVESVLAQHAAVKEAVVVARGEGSDQAKLVAYWTRKEGQSADEEALKAHLRERLPEYMVPAALVALEALPLTPNGKVDRRALPEPGATRDASRDFVPPRNPTEEVLAGIWADLLERERVSIHDHFFELGGHSLLAIQAVARIRAIFEQEISLLDFFEHPTVAALAERIAAPRASTRPLPPPILPAPPAVECLPSYEQEGFWSPEQVAPDHRMHTMPVALRLKGALDEAALARSVEEIVRRHEVLRASFPVVKGALVQRLAPFEGAPLERIDLSDVPESEREKELIRRVDAKAWRPFELARGPLFRPTLFHLAERDHVLLIAMHHTVADVVSHQVLLRELEALYNAFREGRASPLPALPVQYRDYVAWQRQWMQGEVRERLRDYWGRRLAGPLPVLRLPFDRPRPAVESYRGAGLVFRLSPGLSSVLRALCLQEGVTPFMLMLAAFNALLSAYSRQEDILVGFAHANRPRPELDRLIGMFANYLILRSDLSGTPTFQELLKRVRSGYLEAFDHQDLPQLELMKLLGPPRDAERWPPCRVGFAFPDRLARGGGMDGLELSQLPLNHGMALDDLKLYMVDERELFGGMFVYKTDLFDAATIQAMQEHFVTLLECVAAAPDQPLQSLPAPPVHASQRAG